MIHNENNSSAANVSSSEMTSPGIKISTKSFSEDAPLIPLKEAPGTPVRKSSLNDKDVDVCGHMTPVRGMLLAEMKGEVADYKRRFAVLEISSMLLRDELSETTEEFENKTAIFQTLKQDYESKFKLLAEEKITLTKERDNAKEELVTTNILNEREILRLTSKLNQLESENKESLSLVGLNSRLKIQIEDLTKDAEQHGTITQELQTEVSSYIMKLKNAESDLVRMDKKMRAAIVAKTDAETAILLDTTNSDIESEYIRNYERLAAENRSLEIIVQNLTENFPSGYENLINEVENYASSLEDLRNELENKIDIVSQSKEQVQLLEAEVHEAKTTIISLEDRNNSLGEELESLNHQLESGETTCIIRVDLDSSWDLCSIVNGMITDVEKIAAPEVILSPPTPSFLKILSKEKFESGMMISKLELVIEQSKDELSDYKLCYDLQLEAQELVIQDLEQKQVDLTALNEELQEKYVLEITSLNDSINEVKEHNSVIKDKLDASTIQISILKEDLEREQSRNSESKIELEAKVVQLERDILDFQHQMVQQDELTELLTAEKEELLQEKAQVIANGDNLNAKNTALHNHYQGEITTLKAENSRLTKKNIQLDDDFAAALMKIQVSDCDTSDLHSKILELQSTVTNLEKFNTEIEGSNADLSLMLEEKEKEMKLLSEKSNSIAACQTDGTPPSPTGISNDEIVRRSDATTSISDILEGDQALTKALDKIVILTKYNTAYTQKSIDKITSLKAKNKQYEVDLDINEDLMAAINGSLKQLSSSATDEFKVSLNEISAKISLHLIGHDDDETTPTVTPEEKVVVVEAQEDTPTSPSIMI